MSQFGFGVGSFDAIACSKCEGKEVSTPGFDRYIYFVLLRGSSGIRIFSFLYWMINSKYLNNLLFKKQ